MKPNIFLYYIIATTSVLSASCNDNNHKKPEVPDNGHDSTAVFAKGADISWATEMERDGIKFKTAAWASMP